MAHIRATASFLRRDGWWGLRGLRGDLAVLGVHGRCGVGCGLQLGATMVILKLLPKAPIIAVIFDIEQALPLRMVPGARTHIYHRDSR